MVSLPRPVKILPGAGIPIQTEGVTGGKLASDCSKRPLVNLLNKIFWVLGCSFWGDRNCGKETPTQIPLFSYKTVAHGLDTPNSMNSLSRRT
jgi:hypothetical protein